MSEIEICITCGEELLPWFIDSDEYVLICLNCDDDEEYETDQDEDVCLCHEDEMNTICWSCF